MSIKSKNFTRILIVDDNELFLKLYHDVIKANFSLTEIICLQDGILAIDEINDSYDIFIFDINLPCVSGFELIKAVKSNGFKGNVIVVTAFAMTDDAERIISAGADRYLSKPISMKQFLETIGEYIR